MLHIFFLYKLFNWYLKNTSGKCLQACETSAFSWISPFLFSHSAFVFRLRFSHLHRFFCCFFHPTSIIKQHSHRNWFVSSRLLMFLVETLHKNGTQQEEENLNKQSKFFFKVVIKGCKCTVLYLIQICTCTMYI
jgi:hypothetical protein